MIPCCTAIVLFIDYIHKMLSFCGFFDAAVKSNSSCLFFFFLSFYSLSPALMNTFCAGCMSAVRPSFNKTYRQRSHVICMHDKKRTSIWNVSFFLVFNNRGSADEYISWNAIKREKKHTTPNLDDNLPLRSFHLIALWIWPKSWSNYLV